MKINKKIILLNFPPASDYSYSERGVSYPSPAVMLIGTYLKKHGYDVDIIEGAYHEDYIDRLRNAIESNGNILFVGMSVMVTQIPFALHASKTVKEHDRNIPVVWGGPHPTLYPDQTLADEHVDIVAINEGMVTALKLARAFDKNGQLEEIEGIGYKDEDSGIRFTSPAPLENIEEQPFFDFSLIDVNKYLDPQHGSVYQREFPGYKGHVRIMPILTGLGCPYRCQFCINVILKRRYRHRSALSIINEVKRLMETYGANTFLFLDEDFFINKKRIFELASIAEEQGLHFNMRVWCRVDHFKEGYVDRSLLERLTSIGHLSIAMGGESANPEILKALQKGTTPEQIVNSLKIIKDFSGKIFPRYSFMVGLENESMEQIRETYRFCMEMGSIHPVVDIAGPFLFRLYPGSPIFNRLVERYNIPVPGSLDEWSKHMTDTGNSDEMPWTPQEFQQKKELISFYGTYALRFVDSQGSFIMRTGRSVLSKLSRIRIGSFCFFMPFEYWIYKILKSILRRRGAEI